MESRTAQKQIAERAALRWLDEAFSRDPAFKGFANTGAVERHLQQLADRRNSNDRPLRKLSRASSGTDHDGPSLWRLLAKSTLPELDCSDVERSSALLRAKGSAALKRSYKETLAWTDDVLWGNDQTELAYEQQRLDAAPKPLAPGDTGYFETEREGSAKNGTAGLRLPEPNPRVLRLLSRQCSRWQLSELSTQS